MYPIWHLRGKFLLVAGLFVTDKDKALKRRPTVLSEPSLFANDEIIVLSNGQTQCIAIC